MSTATAQSTLQVHPQHTPSRAPLSLSAPRALSAVANSTNAILQLCCVSPSRRILDTEPEGGGAAAWEWLSSCSREGWA